MFYSLEKEIIRFKKWQSDGGIFAHVSIVQVWKYSGVQIDKLPKMEARQ
jgi:hypothetical protein